MRNTVPTARRKLCNLRRWVVAFLLVIGMSLAMITLVSFLGRRPAAFLPVGDLRWIYIDVHNGILRGSMSLGRVVPDEEILIDFPDNMDASLRTNMLSKLASGNMLNHTGTISDFAQFRMKRLRPSFAGTSLYYAHNRPSETLPFMNLRHEVKIDNTVIVFPLYAAVLILAIPASLWTIRWRRLRARRRAGTCPSCGYNLTGAAHERCPECGAAIMPSRSSNGAVP